MRFIVPFSVVFLLIVACNTTKKSSNTVIESPIEISKEPVKETKVNYRDTIIETDSTFEIGKACGVFFTPSDAQLARLIEEIGEDDFFTVMDDYGWYFSEAISYLEYKGLQTITTSEKSVRFHFFDGSIQTVHPGDSIPDWSPILFNGTSIVHKTDLVNIRAAYERIFE